MLISIKRTDEMEPVGWLKDSFVYNDKGINSALSVGGASAVRPHLKGWNEIASNSFGVLLYRYGKVTSDLELLDPGENIRKAWRVPSSNVDTLRALNGRYFLAGTNTNEISLVIDGKSGKSLTTKRVADQYISGKDSSTVWYTVWNAEKSRKEVWCWNPETGSRIKKLSIKDGEVEPEVVSDDGGFVICVKFPEHGPGDLLAYKIGTGRKYTLWSGIYSFDTAFRSAP